MLGPKTAEQVQDEYPVAELDCIAVKGKKLGVKIFTIAPETELHREFLEFYYSGNWYQALKSIPYCQNACPELFNYYEAMKERLEEGKPEDWDGTYRATSK